MKNKDKNSLTIPLPERHGPFLSQFGLVYYGEWCALESERINRAGNISVTVQKYDGGVYIVRA